MNIPYLFFFLIIGLLSTQISGATKPSVAFLKLHSPSTNIRNGIDFTYFQFNKQFINAFENQLIKEFSEIESINIIPQDNTHSVLNKINSGSLVLGDYKQIAKELESDYLINTTLIVEGATLVNKNQANNSQTIQDLFGSVRIKLTIYDTLNKRINQNKTITHEGLLGGGNPPILFQRLQDDLVRRMTRRLNMFFTAPKILEINANTVSIQCFGKPDFKPGQRFEVRSFSSQKRDTNTINGKIQISTINSKSILAEIISNNGIKPGDLCLITD